MPGTLFLLTFPDDPTLSEELRQCQVTPVGDGKWLAQLMNRAVPGRRAQLETPLRQFTLGKSFDIFTPLGPCLVQPTGINLAELHLTTDVSDEMTQEASTSEMIFSAAELIYHDRAVMSRSSPRDLVFQSTRQ